MCVHKQFSLICRFCFSAFPLLLVIVLGITLYATHPTTIPVSFTNKTTTIKENKNCVTPLSFKHYMLYPLQVESLPKIVSNIMKGNKPSEEPINTNYNNSIQNHPVSRCTQPLGLLILIKTCFQNKEKRAALRKTWANSKYLGQFDVPLEYAFVLGNGIYASNTVREEFMREVLKEGDMIIANFVDTYRNNTYKTMAGLHWSIKYCNDFEFLLMVDDDMYISLKNTIKFLRRPPSTNNNLSFQISKGKFGFAQSGEEEFWGGFVYPEPVHPKRNPTNKWFVTWDEYPFKDYPTLVPGAAIIYSRNVIERFVLASPFVKHLSLDDVYLSLIAAKLNIKPARMNDLILNAWTWNPKRSKNQQLRQEKDAIAAHGIKSPKVLIKFWTKFNQGMNATK